MSSREQELIGHTDRAERLQNARDHLAEADRLLASAGYPNEAEIIQRLVMVVESHRANAVAKGASQVPM